jgi:hypothetical protein
MVMKMKDFYLRFLFEEAQRALKEITITDKQKSYEILERQIDELLRNFRALADETEVKDIPLLFEALRSSLWCGAIIGAIIQQEDLLPMMIKLFEENKELKKKVEEFKKFKDGIGYIR